MAANWRHSRRRGAAPSLPLNDAEKRELAKVIAAANA
jgi:hypothetical protein